MQYCVKFNSLTCISYQTLLRHQGCSVGPHSEQGCLKLKCPRKNILCKSLCVKFKYLWSCLHQLFAQTCSSFKKKVLQARMRVKELENYFSGNDDGNSRSETVVIINCVLNIPLMLISIIGNTLVLAAILRTPLLRSPSTTLLCSLAVSDLLVGLVVQPTYTAGFRLKNMPLYNAAETMALIGCGVSLLTMTAIAVDRFLALHYHMRYPNIMTTSRVMYLSATLWVVAVSLSFFNCFRRGCFFSHCSSWYCYLPFNLLRLLRQNLSYSSSVSVTDSSPTTSGGKYRY